MTAAHIQGPWTDGNEAILAKVDRVRPWVSTIFRKCHDGSEANALVAMCFGATIEEAVALSRLIAAAPELLALVEKIDRWIQRSEDDEDCEYLNGEGWDDLRILQVVGRAAIAKARGAA
ncbi:hypothetical protein F1640_15095 [Novosphingobium sp. NBM11]|uniref:hypothetical protein n=1 Tax=Novosphingobium sp. NBM11 TaxID=2596914 RepID=UPI001891FC4A|nr:hypothetical protein [Novosphingobium sp. NBM11]MBF5091312.1 hypothetical protein [Novosphingobium sp. NBM11]